FFKLSFQHILLLTLSNTIAGIGNFLDLIEELAISVENLQRLLNVGGLKVGFLHLLNNQTLHRFELGPADGGVLLCGFAFELQLSRIRKILRDAESHISEVAIAVAGKRPRTADRKGLYRDLRIGQGGDLRRNLSCRLPAPSGSKNIGIVPRCLIEQSRKWCGRRICGWQIQIQTEQEEAGFEDSHRCASAFDRSCESPVDGERFNPAA